MNPEELQKWDLLLQNLLCNDTQTIQQATQVVNEQMQNAMSIVALFHLLQGSNNIGVKQLSSILLRKRVGGHWTSLNQQTQEAIKVTIIDILTKDETVAPRVIKRAVADLAGVVARLTVTQNQWPNFLEFMTQLTLAPAPLHRELGVYILVLMISSTAIREELLIPHIASVHSMIDRALKDAVPAVRIIGMEAYSEIIKHLSKEQIQPFLPSIADIVVIMKYCLQEEEDAAAGFEIFEILVEEHLDLLQPVLQDLTHFMLSIVSNQEFELRIKTQAINFLTYVISFKTKTFLETNILQQVIDIAFGLLCEPEDDDYAESQSGYKYGGELLDNICINVPPKFSWEILQRKVSDFFQSPDANRRKAAVTALALFSDGYGDYIERGFADVMKMVMSALHDPESVVRDAAFYCLGEISKNLLECLVEYKDNLLPALQAGLQDASDLVRIKCCYALSRCTNILVDQIKVKLPEVLNMLMTLAQFDKNIEVRELALSCLCTAIQEVGEDFEPFFGPVMLVLRSFLNYNDSKDMILRGRAMECTGCAFSVLRPELWQPIIKDIMVVGIKGVLEHNDVDLRQYTYVFFESMVKTSPDDLLDFLPEIVKMLITSVESNEGVVYQRKEKESLEGIAQDLDEGFEEGVKIQVLSHFMEEKVQAIETLGWFAANLEGDFAGYFEESFASLLKLTNYIDADVVSSVTVSLVQMLSCLQVLSSISNLDEETAADQDIDLDLDYVPGEIKPLDANFVGGLNIVLDKFIENKDFADLSVVQSTVEAFGKVAQLFGPSAVHTHLPQIIDFITSILERKTTCQLHREVFDDDNAEEYSLFHTTMEALIEISKSLEKLLCPYMQPLLQRLNVYLGESVPETYRAECIGLTTMMAEGMGSSFLQFVQPLLTMAIPLLKSQNLSTIRNAIYCIRNMIEIGGSSIMLYIPQVFADISNIFSNPQNLTAHFVPENACAAFAAMVNVNPPGLPLPPIVQCFVNTLPIKDDFETAPIIYDCVIQGLKSNHPAFMAHLPSLIGILTLQYVEHGENLQDLPELLEEIENTLKSFAGTYRSELENIFMTLIQSKEISPENEGKLRELLA